jgi:hypothetical protein
VLRGPVDCSSVIVFAAEQPMLVYTD